MSDWHPMLLLTERETGMWAMSHPTNPTPFGGIAIRRTEASLRVASERLWRAYLAKEQANRQGPPNGRCPTDGLIEPYPDIQRPDSADGLPGIRGG